MAFPYTFTFPFDIEDQFVGEGSITTVGEMSINAVTAIQSAGAGVILLVGNAIDTARTFAQVVGGVINIIGDAIDTFRGFVQDVGQGSVGAIKNFPYTFPFYFDTNPGPTPITGTLLAEVMNFLQNVGQGVVAITGTPIQGLVRLLYATIGGAYRTFIESIHKYRSMNEGGRYRDFNEPKDSYRKFKQGGDYRRFKEK